MNGRCISWVDNNGLASDTLTIKVLNSGNVVANAFLKSWWSKDMNADDFGELCYFIIKYFDKYERDYKVGLGRMKPQI